MNVKLLSIVIPTYNRASFLDQSLNILAPQIVKYKNQIEFAISDNASTDNTEEVVRKYSEAIDIIYFRNKNNIGFERNFEKLLDNTSSKYVYLMGDDDIVAPDFLDNVISILESVDDLGLVHWNRLSGNGECKNNVIVDKDYDEQVWTGTPSDFIFKIMDNATFISSIIFNRECWKLGSAYVGDKYLGFEWFSRLYWGALLLNKPCSYYYFPLVLQRNPSKTWAMFWPQYLISSLSEIFLELDRCVPNIYEKWSNKLRVEVPKYLHIVAYHRDYYRQKSIRKRLIRHLNRKERFNFYCYLFIPGSLFIHRIKNKVASKAIKYLS